MNREMGLRLGSSVGTTMGVDHRIEGGNMGEFLCILVQVDIRKPLRRCVLLGAAPGKPATPCPLRYERLPEFCYIYGLVGHDLAACTSKPADLENKRLQYGSWLRVQTQQPRPGPNRSTGIEYFSESASGSPESSSTNAPVIDAQAPTAAPATFSLAGVDTAQEPHGTKATTDATAVAAATFAKDGTEPAATDFSSLSRTESAYVLGSVEGDACSQVNDVVPPLRPCQLIEPGLGNSSTVRFLGDFVAQHTPALVFLCETRLRNSSSSRIKASLGMEGCFTVDFGNGCNGLMLLWNNEINVNLLSYSATHIDAAVDSPTGSFRFTGFHGYYTESMKHLNWSLFDRLRQASSLPWLIGGDFNELLFHSEKEGGRRNPRALIDNFRECLHRNDLFDCKPSSGWFTFTYNNGSHGTIRERLDCFVASPDWLSRHSLFRATSSFTSKLDHCILLMDSDPIVGNGTSRRGGDYFRYDNCWATESACIDKVHTVWSFTAGSAIDKLSAIGGALRNWQHNRRKSTTKRIGELQRFLGSCMHGRMADFLAVATPLSSGPALQPVNWSPPVGTVTLNVDGSFHSDGGAGIGVVARDSSGQVLCGLARHMDNLSEVEFAEHSTLLAELHLVLDRGWTRVQIEMDSAQTVNRLCRPSSCDLSIFGLSLEPVRAILSAHPHIRLRYIPQSANRVAHTLSSWALTCGHVILTGFRGFSNEAVSFKKQCLLGARHINVYWELGAGGAMRCSYNSFFLSIFETFSFMGDCAAGCFLVIRELEDGSSSRLSESRVRRCFGHMFGRLVWPCPGHRFLLAGLPGSIGMRSQISRSGKEMDYLYGVFGEGIVRMGLGRDGLGEVQYIWEECERDGEVSMVQKERLGVVLEQGRNGHGVLAKNWVEERKVEDDHVHGGIITWQHITIVVTCGLRSWHRRAALETFPDRVGRHTEKGLNSMCRNVGLLMDIQESCSSIYGPDDNWLMMGTVNGPIGLSWEVVNLTGPGIMGRNLVNDGPIIRSDERPEPSIGAWLLLEVWMADEMEKQMENLNFSEEELSDLGGSEFTQMGNKEGSEKWLVGKLISPNLVDTGFLIRVFFAVWQETPLEEAVTLGPNMFLFKFKEVESKVSVINRCPWSFNGELLALKVFDGMLSAQEYDFGPLPMWLRVYKVPLGMMSQQMGESIGARLGSHIAVDMREGDGRMGHWWEVCTLRPEGFEGPYQFGEWLKVDMGKQGTGRKPWIVYKEDKGKAGLRPIMPTCIAPNQSAFVPGRIISNNVLIANELMHYLKGSKNGPNKGSAIKLDMEKAYDRVEWHFLAAMMSKLGFDDRWIDLVMKCVTSVSYCIRMNETVSDFFSPTRGLRQGDPLSPFLFLFCTQGLSALLLKEQAEGRIKRVRASQAGPRVNHLLYADDCILFIKNSPSEATRVLEVLSEYEAASGQKVNKDKSTIYFSTGMSDESKSNIQAILCMQEEEDLGTYLGLPLIVGKNKTNALGFLNSRVDKRVLGWTKSLLSYGGREVLIKAVAQALPTYSMMCFLLPDCIIDPLISTMRNFWWSGKEKERGWALVAWERLCRPKAMGGMAKYFRDGNIFDAELKEKASYIWTGIYKANEALKEGYHWRVGRDSEVKMLQDKWGGEKPVKLEGSYVVSPTNPIRCKEFMVAGTLSWDALTSLCEHREETPLWKILAKLPVLPKIRIFGWRLGQEALPVGQRVRATYMGDDICKLCRTSVESPLHAVRECPTVQEVLHVSGLDQLLPHGPFRSCLEWLEYSSTLLDKEQFTFLIVIAWNVWNRRNRWVHNNQLIPVRLVSEYAQIIMADFQRADESLVERSSCTKTKRWVKPTQGQIKINVDGAWSSATKIATIGVIARDHHGLMINGCAHRVEGSHTTDTVEAMAFAEGVRMALSNGWENAVIEGDAKGIVNRLNATELDDSVATTHLVETWTILRHNAGLSVQHVLREANRAAHELAHYCCIGLAEFFFVDVIPPIISDIVIDDAIYG
ncbi:hypothetical protein GQ457_17G007720 [Hibiscus cannabinus]